MARRRRKLGDAAFERIFREMVSNARQYRDGQIGPERVRQWNYYKGLVNAQPRRNRSSAVSTEVRDTVEAVHAQLMKMFGASGHLVDYQPTSALSQGQAEVATDYIHYVFLRQNRGWTVLSDFFRDGLVADIGVFYHRAEDVDESVEEEYEGLTPDEADALASAEDVTVLERHTEEDEDADEGDTEDEPAASSPSLPAPPPALPMSMPTPGGASGGTPGGPGTPPSLGGTQQGPPPAGTPAPPPAAPPQLDDEPPGPSIYLRLSRRISKTAIRVTTVPPDEFLLDPSCATPEDAKIMGIDCTRTVGDMTASGFKYKEVIDYAGTDRSLTAERQARSPHTLRQRDANISEDPTTWPLTVIQANVRIDADGDGVPEMWRVTALGEEFHIIERERTDDWEFTVGSPYNVPHAVIGTGVARQVLDLQDIQTSILRQQLDSLYQAINPKYYALEGQVNIDDALDEGFARVVRVRQPGAYGPIQIPFIGEAAFPMIDRLDKIREFRTGVSPQSAGLDPDSLQSSTEVGVRAVVGQAQLRIETIARNYAENAITDLFRALLKLAVRYQDRIVSFKTAQGYLTVDPQGLDPDMNVIPVVGLGNDSDQVRLGTLAMVKQAQEQIATSLGPSNPLVGLSEYRNTLADMLSLSPFQNTSRYFKPLPPNIDQIMAQQAQQHAQQPDPQTQAIQARTQAQNQALQTRTQAQIATEAQRHQADQQRDQQKMALEQWTAQQQMQLEKMKAEADMQLQRLKQMNDLRTDMMQLNGEMALERIKILSGSGHPNGLVPNPNEH